MKWCIFYLLFALLVVLTTSTSEKSHFQVFGKEANHHPVYPKPVSNPPNEIYWNYFNQQVQQAYHHTQSDNINEKAWIPFIESIESDKKKKKKGGKGKTSKSSTYTHYPGQKMASADVKHAGKTHSTHSSKPTQQHHPAQSHHQPQQHYPPQPHYPSKPSYSAPAAVSHHDPYEAEEGEYYTRKEIGDYNARQAAKVGTFIIMYIVVIGTIVGDLLSRVAGTKRSLSWVPTDVKSLKESMDGIYPRVLQGIETFESVFGGECTGAVKCQVESLLTQTPYLNTLTQYSSLDTLFDKETKGSRENCSSQTTHCSAKLKSLINIFSKFY